MHRQEKMRLLYIRCATALAAASIATFPAWLAAQQSLPSAPEMNLVAGADQSPAPAVQVQNPGANGPMQNSAQNAQMSAQPPDGVNGPRLTLEQAEQLAYRNNPNISIARLLALAQGQVTRQARSIELPQAFGDLNAADAHADSRFTGGDVSRTLTGSRMFDKAAAGLTVRQLITDFGHTHNMVKSAQSGARAEVETQRATELDIKLAVDQAFYQALTSQAVLKVAQRTVAQRQATGDQVSALTKAKVKSDLDLSFANVQIAQANLLLLDAENNEAASMAALNTVLGSEQDQQYVLVDESNGNPPPAPSDPEAMVQQAFAVRPDLAALNERSISAKQYATAERDQWLPTVTAVAAGGGTPVRSNPGNLIQSSWYMGAGVNVNIPVFNGFLYNAEAKEADYRASATQEQVRSLRDTVARDVRTAVLNAQTAFRRIGVTQDMLNQANFALDLAQARYKIGLSSIVELTQAQLAQTQAEIDNTNALYSYQTALAEVRYEIGQ